MDKIRKFPSTFRWGSATSSYQIEGASALDGKGSGIWDDFCNMPGAIRNGDRGDIACDHYHRYPEDIRLMQELGIDSYRLSISWPRLFPDGSKNINQKGIDFYNRLIDSLQDADIEPWMTLYHWDMPTWIQDNGGWESRHILNEFEDYATLAARRYGDRVKNFIVINEPSVTSYLGHYLGIFAPGKKGKTPLIASSHHQNVAHGIGVRVLRNEVTNPHIGSSYTYFPVRPQNPLSTDDRQAALIIDAVWTRNYIDPALKGRYPDLMAGDFEPYIKPGDMDIISAPVDYLGINHYNPNYASADNSELGACQSSGPEGDRTDIGWLIEPTAFGDCFRDIRDRYGNLPVYVTENGMCENSLPDAKGSISDDRRVQYMSDYIGAMAGAIQDGCDVRGYFSWSLMDNFEWASGFEMRFGIIHVDYKTQKRTPKKSYYWYQKFLRNIKEERNTNDNRKNITGT